MSIPPDKIAANIAEMSDVIAKVKSEQSEVVWIRDLDHLPEIFSHLPYAG